MGKCKLQPEVIYEYSNVVKTPEKPSPDHHRRIEPAWHHLKMADRNTSGYLGDDLSFSWFLLGSLLSVLVNLIGHYWIQSEGFWIAITSLATFSPISPVYPPTKRIIPGSRSSKFLNLIPRLR